MTPDALELLDCARDWQKQFHQLEALCNKAGYEVGYGEHGEVTMHERQEWRQVENLHRWELVRDGSVAATCWHEGNTWHWSVPGNGMPRRGADGVFRKAVKAAEEAAK